MQKIDLRKEALKPFYRASGRDVVELELPPQRYLMVDGAGDPNLEPAYAEAVEALFSVSYTAKFMLKKSAKGVDYAVMPLEGLWWADDLSVFSAGDKSRWQWTMMILQPAFVPPELIEAAIAAVKKKAAKKKTAPPSEAPGLPALERLRLEVLDEGRCAQVLHTGPFSEEGPTIERLHRFIDAHGGRRGKHHEIYLSDIRRADPSRWKTLIRQPMR